MNSKIQHVLNGAIAAALLLILALGYDLAVSGPGIGDNAGLSEKSGQLPEDTLAREIAELEERLANEKGGDIYDWLDLAHLHRLHGDPAAAARVLERALSRDDLIAEQRYALTVRLAEAQLEAGQLERSWASATAASLLNPERAPAFNRRGDVRSVEGETESALKEYATASRVEPAHAESYAKRAAIHAERGETERAEEVLVTGLQASREAPNADSKDLLNRSAAPQSAAAAKSLADFYLKHGQTERAIEILGSALADFPRAAGLWSAMGDARSAAATDARRSGLHAEADEHNARAIAAYTRSARLQSRNAALHERLGDLYARDGERELAHASYRTALRYNQKSEALRKKYLATRAPDAGGLQMAVRADGAIVVSDAANTAGSQSSAHETDRASRESRLIDSADAGAASDSSESILVQTTDASGREVTAALPNLYQGSSSATDAATLKQAGRDLYLKKQYALAYSRFQAAAERSPQDSEARYLSGRAAAQLNRRDDARSAYEAAIRLNPNDYRPHYHLGELHYRYRNYSGARKAFENALRAKPDLHTARYNLALSQTRSGKDRAAIQTYRELLKKEPQRWRAALNLAILLKKNRAPSDALRLLNDYTRTHPKEAALHYQQGEVQASLGKTDDALESYARTLAIDPQHYQAHFNSGVLHGRAGRVQTALSSYAAAMQINRRDPALHYAIGRLQSRAKDSQGREAAIEAFERCLALQPGHADAAIEAVPLYLQSGRKLDAIATMQRATQSNPRNYRLQFNAGNLYRKLTEHQSARDAYERAIQLKSGRAEAYLNLALSYRDTKDTARAIQTYRSLLAVQPAHPAGHEQLGLLLWQAGDAERPAARQHLERYLELQPRGTSADRIRQMLGAQASASGSGS